MIRSTILPLTLCGTLISHCAAQDAPQSAAQASTQTAESAQAVTAEETSTPPLKKESKSSTRRSVVTRARGVPEVRTFTFGNDAFPGQRYGTEAFGGQRGRPLMIRSSRADAKAMEQLSEDLTVMTRLLEKAVVEHGGGLHPRKAAGIDIVTLNGGMPNAGGAMYVDDYGVIFTLSVNMPLKAEPKVEEVEPKEPKRHGAWEETRSELYGGQRRRVLRWQPSAWRQFDQAEVDAFKTALIETLREATNIRHLRPTDMIAVVVRGMPQAEQRDIMLQIEGKGNDENKVLEESSSLESTLVLRIQKADLDRTASARDSGGELRKAIRISIY
jgi:hypothetical protein